MSWKETATVFSTSWDSVYRAVQWVVHWGIVHRELTGIESFGIGQDARASRAIATELVRGQRAFVGNR
jgi:hypothetical protein